MVERDEGEEKKIKVDYRRRCHGISMSCCGESGSDESIKGEMEMVSGCDCDEMRKGRRWNVLIGPNEFGRRTRPHLIEKTRLFVLWLLKTRLGVENGTQGHTHTVVGYR